MKRNPNIAKLRAGYLFPEIAKRRRAAAERHPDKRVISLGIGDTTEPLAPHIASALERAAAGLGTNEGYSGYGAEQGMVALRERIAEVFYPGMVDPDEVFVSDGSKCDIGRLQAMFGSGVTVAVQDPSYPVYVDGSVLTGASGTYNEEKGNFDGITYMRCTADNSFFPDLSNTPRTDLIYFCTPNNPTGAVATKQQLTELVEFATRKKSIIIVDTAYREYIEDDLPRSIYEIPGAKAVAIETNSFSKSVGFTGVRLGYTVVPKELCYDDGTPVIKDWNRIMTTIFNGASNIVQHGGIAALDAEGLKEMRATVAYYKENARIIKQLLDSLGIESYGGKNSPYIWAHFPGKKSWDAFEDFLEEALVVTTPGSGFGPAGEGFLRFSAFGHRADVEEAARRLKENLSRSSN